MMVITTVLLVDDEPEVRRVGQLSLERVGKWRTILASGGEEAVATAARERPDLVLLDVMMPGLDGPSTLRQLRTTPGLEQTPVIFLTARSATTDVEWLLGLGALAVIRKPFDPFVLPGQIRDAVAVRDVAGG